MTTEANRVLHLEREQWDRAVQVADGFWIIATHHRPGYSRFNPQINNRALVFRLRDASAGGAEVLAVVNTPDLSAVAEVRRLERETGLQVRYVIAPGGGHNVLLPAWHDEFTSAKVLVGPVRIPRTAAGKKLAASARFAAMDAADPLPQFKGQLEAVNFDGLLGFRENRTPQEGGKDSMFGLLKILLTEMPPKDPTDELWLFHVGSRTVIAGENLGWILSREDHKAMPLMMRLMMKPERVAVMTGPRGVADPARVAGHWSRILAWPAEVVMTYHDSLGKAFVGDGRAALTAAARAARQIKGT
jgi:hypothetical protein